MQFLTKASEPARQPDAMSRCEMQRVWPWWLLLIALCAVELYGFRGEHLFRKETWTPLGMRRLCGLAAAFGSVYALLAWRKPRWLIPALVSAALGSATFLAGPAAVLSVTFFCLSSYALGRRFLPGDRLLATMLGTAVWVFAITLLVRFPVNYPLLWGGLFLLPLATQGRQFYRDLLRSQRWLLYVPPPAIRGALGLLAFTLLVQLLVALKPEVGGDALAMHLAVPAWVRAHHEWSFDARHVVWAVMPMAADWCFTAVYLLGGESASRLFNFAMLLAIAGLLYRLIRRWLDVTTALLLVAVFASTPLLQLLTGSLLVENTLTAFLTAGFAAGGRYAETRQRKYALAAAVLLGTGMAAKLGGTAYVVALLPVALWTLRRDLRTLALAAFCLVLFAAPPYITAYVRTGNPIFPFANHIFQSVYFDNAARDIDFRFHERLRWNTLYYLTFRTQHYMESSAGAAGFALLLLLPMSIAAFCRRGPALARAALATGLLFAVLVFRGQANLRYLFPAYPLFFLAAGALLAKLSRLRTSLCGALIAITILQLYFLPTSNSSHRDLFLNPFNPAELTRYIEVEAPERPLVDFLNRQAPGEPVVFLESNHIAGLQGLAYTNTWHHDAFVRHLQRATTMIEALRVVYDTGARYLIAPTAASGAPITQPVMQTLLTVCTVPSQKSGRFYIAKLKDEYQGLAGLQRAADYQLHPPTALPGVYDDASPELVFTGEWIRDSQFAEAYRHTLTYCRVPGGEVELTFEGDAVTWLYTRAPNRGQAEVIIDRRSHGIVDLYQGKIVWQARAAFSGLGPGRHHLTLRVRPERNPAATDGFIDVDALMVQAGAGGK